MPPAGQSQTVHGMNHWNMFSSREKQPSHCPLNISFICLVYKCIQCVFAERYFWSLSSGADRFYSNIEDMIGYKPIFFIKWCWKYFTPGICAVSWTRCTESRDIYSLWAINAKFLVIRLSFQGIFLFFLIKYKPLKYNNVYTYPDWGYGIGWMMAMSSMVCIPVGIVVQIWKTKGTFREVKAFFFLF